MVPDQEAALVGNNTYVWRPLASLMNTSRLVNQLFIFT